MPILSDGGARHARPGCCPTFVHGRLAAAALVLWLVAAGRAAAEPSLRVELAREQIFEGESVLYRVTVSGVEDPLRPELPESKDFRVAPRGESSQSRVTITNGRRSESRSVAYDYLLTPLRSGDITVPPPRMEVNGRTLTGRPVVLTVVPPGEQDLVALELTADRQEVYPSQPFTITLTVAVKGLPEPLEEDDPIALLRDPPRLEIPWVDDDQLQEHLEPRVAWQRWLGNWRHPRGAGFRINGIRATNVFSLLDQSGMGFLPQPRRVRRAGAGQEGAGTYWEYEFPRTFTADRVGEYSFGPAHFKGRVVSGIVGQRHLEGEDVYALAGPLTVRVQDAPVDGRPATYIQAIGAFDVAATVTPRQAQVGDPLTLTITLRGQGTLDTALPPDLQGMPDVSERFRIYEATSKTEEGRKQFVYSLRPLAADVREFPAIPVSYFDVDQERYRTLRTEPIPLEVRAAAARLAAGDITAGDAAEGLVSREQGLFPNITDLSLVRDQRVRPVRWVLGALGLGGLYLAGIVVARCLRSGGAIRNASRWRPALLSAERGLDAARNLLDDGRTREAMETARGALAALVGELRGVDAAGLTTPELERELNRLELAPDVVRRVVDLLETCDAARYGGGVVDRESFAASAGAVLEGLAAGRKRSRWTG